MPVEGVKCARCGATSAPGMRFCITCGSPIEKPAAPVAVPQSALPPPAPVAATAIAPSPVAMVSQAAAVTETRVCKRCQGASDKNAQFCRFCGASFAESSNPGSPSGQPMRPTLPSAAAPAAVASAIAAAQLVADVRAPVDGTSRAPNDGSAPSQPRLDATLVTKGPLSSPPPAYGKLVVVHKDGGLGASFALYDQVDIGRSEGECIFADDRYMAPRHARIARKDGGLFVRDLGTANGVYARLRKDDTSRLEDQDLILLGQQVLRFEVVKDAEAGFGAASEQGTLVFGTPSGPRYARLSQRTTEGVSCDVFHIRKPETVLGRESGDVVFPDDPFMSRRHAAIRALEGATRAFALADLGSSNGTFVRIRTEVALQHGDEIRVGQQLLRVDLG